MSCPHFLYNDLISMELTMFLRSIMMLLNVLHIALTAAPVSQFPIISEWASHTSPGRG